MSDPSSDNKIIIKFEVHVPMTGGAPAVIMPQSVAQPAAVPPAAVPAPAPASGGPFLSCTELAGLAVGSSPRALAGVTLPVDTALVKVTTNSQTICVTHDQDSSILGVPVDVYVKVQPPAAPLPGVILADDTPPGLRAEPIGIGGSFYQWRHLAVPNVACAAPGTGVVLPSNRLLVWRKYNLLPFWTRESVLFQGECSTMTDCDDERIKHGFAETSQVIDTAPVALCTLVQGFGGALCQLNGRWLLIRKPGGTHATWSCGGDGHGTPRVELIADSCGCEPVKLRLSCAGVHALYSAPRKQFNPLGQSRFVRCGDPGALVGCDAPGELSVVPA